MKRHLCLFHCDAEHCDAKRSGVTRLAALLALLRRYFTGAEMSAPVLSLQMTRKTGTQGRVLNENTEAAFQAFRNVDAQVATAPRWSPPLLSPAKTEGRVVTVMQFAMMMDQES